MFMKGNEKTCIDTDNNLDISSDNNAFITTACHKSEDTREIGGYQKDDRLHVWTRDETNVYIAGQCGTQEIWTQWMRHSLAIFCEGAQKIELVQLTLCCHGTILPTEFLNITSSCAQKVCKSGP